MKTAWAYLGLGLAIGGCLSLSLCSQAMAQAVCGDKAGMLAMAREKFGETPAVTGKLGERARIDITLSESGSFSIFATLDDGRTCLIATGDEWRQTRLPGRRASLVERLGDAIKPR